MLGVSYTLYVGIIQTRNNYKIISQNLKNGKVINLYNNIPFIFNKIPSGEKKHEESTKEKREKILGGAT